MFDQDYNGLSLRRQEFLLGVASSFQAKMNRIILHIFAVGLCFAIGHALECYKCEFGVGSLCYTTKITCAEGEQCFSGVGKAGGEVSVIKTKGCLQSDECNGTETTTALNQTVYTVTKTCCNTNLCNAAPGLPQTTTLPLAIATAVMMAMVLV